MKPSFRHSMGWLHTWAGLVFCWVLYFMFVTGTLGYFDFEVDHWMKPEQVAIEPAPLAQSLDAALGYLEKEAEGADRWLISFNEDRSPHPMRLFWSGPEPEEGEERISGNKQFDPNTGEPVPEDVRATGGGQTLYQMHYSLHYVDGGGAFVFIAIVTMFMFIGLVTGVVIHARIFKDLFTFRPSKGGRAWLDMHNLLSVSTLPFQLMITYSGLLFTVTTWMPLIAVGSYGFDIQRVAADLGNLADVRVERAEEQAELTDLKALALAAEAEWGAGQVQSVDVKFPYDANSRVVVRREVQVGAVGESKVYDGVTGEFLRTLNPASRAPIAVASVMIGLHEGLYAGTLLRWLYFFSGLLGAGMVATGAIYWTVKRRRQASEQEKRGFRFVECMNIGTILGLPIGIGCYFWANRLLPLGLENRANWEVHCLFIAWTFCLLYPLTRPARAAWRELAWAGSAVFGAIPMVNALTTDAHLINSLRGGDWVMASFDVTALAFGVLFAAVARTLGRREARAQEALETGTETAAAVGVS
ncbi:MAG: PepSY-associated TM helix domain-containing protein [Acidobacteriota bacterium]